MAQYINAHPERPVLAHVTPERATWLASISPEESDKYVMLASTNLVNCIAFVPISVIRDFRMNGYNRSTSADQAPGRV